MASVTIKTFGLQPGSDRGMYITWTWGSANTENYQVIWSYDNGNSIWLIGSDSTATHYDDLSGGQSTYSAPSSAKRVKVKIKPISKKHTVNDTETSYWTANWSTEKVYNFSSNPPVKPGTPSVSIDKYTLEAELTGVTGLNATTIRFQVIQDDFKVFKTADATINTDLDYVRFTCKVDAGSKYKVRCRSRKDSALSDWTDYSSSVTAIPSAPSAITVCKAKSETSVYLEWKAVTNAETYDIEYTTKKDYFDGSDETSTVTGITTNHYEKTGLGGENGSGAEYFFRVRAVNTSGYSAWSNIKSVKLGTKPAAPTTWSSTTTVTTGDPLTLYWVHNSEDGSSQVFAELETVINGVKSTVPIQNTTDEDEKDKTSKYSIDTSQYIEGTKILWCVRTSGITGVYGDWSIQRTIDVYAPPTLVLNVPELTDGDDIPMLTTFPMTITGIAGPNTQEPIGYHLTIVANDSYETVDNIGNAKIVNSGQEVYSKYFNTSHELLATVSAGDVDLENNVRYTIKCTVSMNSGLTADASVEFLVSWEDIEYEPNAEIGIDYETLTASIRPYCINAYGVYIPDVLLSVYRREFDGTYTMLAENIPNARNTFITDPHPALDFARYRIVALTQTTGAVCYYDIPAYPVGEKAVILQWDEKWSAFDATDKEVLEQAPWTGSMLKLPYNIDVSDNYSTDVSLVEYIGRKHPVSYYGTQTGETSSWNVEIDKKDKETLHALRRLAIWMGDVYVREPSGSGYWANVSVSFSQAHLDLVIPVTLDITRVEGGI